MSEKPEISAIVVNRNSRELLSGCLDSLASCPSSGSIEIIVVDNASTDGSADMVRRKYPSVRLIVNDHNAGFAAANNQALRIASGRWFLLINNDAYFKGDLPGRLRSFLDEHPRAALVGPKLLRPDGSPQYSVYPRPGPLHSLLKLLRAYRFVPAALRGRLFSGPYFDYSSAASVDRISGACLMVRAEAAAAVGPLDEDFFFYGEVHDWCWRMSRAGWETWYFPGAEAVHYGGQASAGQWDRERRQALMLEATFRLYSKHFNRAKKWLVVILDFLCSVSAWPRSGLAGFEAKWYARRFFRSLRSRAVPAYFSWFYETGLYERMFRKRLASLLGRSGEEIDGFFAESSEVAGEIRAAWSGAKAPPPSGGQLSYARTVYVLVRLLKPGSVLETGAAAGATSFFILEALSRNGNGSLYSIDAGEQAEEGSIPEGKEAGWLVPADLRKRWTLEIGSPREILLPVLRRIGKIDLFFHDGSREYANMRFEFSAAWPFISEGGALASSRAGGNEAFQELLAGSGADHAVKGARLGIALKRGG